MFPLKTQRNLNRMDHPNSPFHAINGRAQGDCRRRSRAPYHISIGRREPSSGRLASIAWLRYGNRIVARSGPTDNAQSSNMIWEPSQSCWATLVTDFALRALGMHVYLPAPGYNHPTSLAASYPALDRNRQV